MLSPEAEGASHDIATTFHGQSIVSPDVRRKHSGGVFLKSCDLLHKSCAWAELALPNPATFLGRSFGGPKWLPSQGFSPAGFLQLRVMSKLSRLWSCLLEQAWSCRCSWRRAGWISASDFCDPTTIVQGSARDPAKLFRSFAATKRCCVPTKPFS